MLSAGSSAHFAPTLAGTLDLSNDGDGARADECDVAGATRPFTATAQGAPTASPARAPGADELDERKSLESSELLSALRSQLRELDGVHARLQRHLARTGPDEGSPVRPSELDILRADDEARSAPRALTVHLARAEVEDERRAAVAESFSVAHAADGDVARAQTPPDVPVLLPSPSRDPDQQTPSEAPTPPPARESALGGDSPHGGGRAIGSPARLARIRRILRASRSGARLWEEDESSDD